MESDIKYHIEKLKAYCRLCKVQRVLSSNRKKPLDAREYKRLIFVFHGLKVEEDDPKIYPRYICDVCRNRLERYNKLKRSKREFDVTFIPREFVPHANDCAICLFSPRRSPRKSPRKIPQPGSVTKSSKRLLSPVREEQPKAKHPLIFPQDIPSTSQGFSQTEFEYEDIPVEVATTEVIEHEPSSLPVDTFIEKELADKIKCQVCSGVSKRPVASECGHIFCKECIKTWLNAAFTCPRCSAVVSSDSLMSMPFETTIHEVLHVPCKYTSKGCKVSPIFKDLSGHESQCRYGMYPASILKKKSTVTRGPGVEKIPLAQANRKYIIQKRLKEIIDTLDEFCIQRHENKCDVLYFLLHHELCIQGEKKKAAQIYSLWDKTGKHLSADECLSLRVKTLQSKQQYRKQYEFLKQRGDETFCAPNQLEQAVKNYFPGSVHYQIRNESEILFEHNSELSSVPISVLAGLSLGTPEIPVPNCKGVRWNYATAIASTLQEMDPLIEENLSKLPVNEQIIKVMIKDGGDGLGEISVYKEKGDRYLPDKALRFSFCVISCSVETKDKDFVLYQEEYPNSVRKNRPLLEALADENSSATAAVCIDPIERERENLKGKELRVEIEKNKWRTYRIHFTSSMLDEKYDRSMGGLAGAGSTYLCTLCDATRHSAIIQLGQFSVTRSLEETNNLATYLKLNPDNLPADKLDKVVKGVKSTPILLSQPKERMVDATHADINLASFFKKLIVRCIARVFQWDATSNVKKMLEDAEVKFDSHVKRNIGSNPQLMLPGNYARMLFDIKNEQIILSLTSQEQRPVLEEILQRFRKMRKVYRANDPDATEVSNYKSNAVEMGKLLIKHFPFCKWPNYLHKIIEHVQELTEDKNGPGSIGAVSGEGNEAGNKIFRHFRKNLSSKGNTQQSLTDVLKLHWLYSSPKLQMISNKTKRSYRCTACKGEGHSRLTCSKIQESQIQ